MHKSALPQEGTETFQDQIRIVLVETSHSGNIGAVARAMKNMGLGNLWLVNPASFPDEASYARAAGASDVLDNAHVVSSLDEALSDCVLVMGTSARGRKVPWPVCAPPEAAAAAAGHAENGPVALVFGRESWSEQRRAAALPLPHSYPVQPGLQFPESGHGCSGDVL